MQTMQYEIVAVRHEDIKKGDRFGTMDGGWIAQADATVIGGNVHVKVQYEPDGGLGERVWDRNMEGANISVGRPVQVDAETAEVVNPTETFTFHIDVKGKENIERISDALQAGGNSNLLIEIERLIATKANGVYEGSVPVMDAHRFAFSASHEALENFTVRED